MDGLLDDVTETHGHTVSDSCHEPDHSASRAPLRPGDRIGVTSPSAGVTGASAARIDFCVDWLRGRGYDVVVGECIDGDGLTSAPRSSARPS